MLCPATGGALIAADADPTPNAANMTAKHPAARTGPGRPSLKSRIYPFLAKVTATDRPTGPDLSSHPGVWPLSSEAHNSRGRDQQVATRRGGRVGTSGVQPSRRVSAPSAGEFEALAS